MNIWHEIDPKRITKDKFIAVIEISKGSKNKYELDKETGMLRLDRVLFTSTHYPANYGFIPLTYAGDNDPLDVLVLCQEKLLPMSILEVYPIGVFKMVDSCEVDEKIIAIPCNDPSLNNYKEIKELPIHVVQEMTHFFEVYKQLENKETHIISTEDSKSAKKIIQESIERYKKIFKNKK